MIHAFSTSQEDILSHFHTQLNQGLSLPEREKRLLKHGTNTFPEPPKPSLLQHFIEQMKNPIVLLLIGTSIIAGITGEALESALIIGIVAFMAGVGVFLEKQSEKSLEKLKALQTATTTILVDGKNIQVPTESIVPGDILVLTEGDKVAADARIVQLSNLHVDESALTGESLPVKKVTDTLPLETPLADQKNMLFSGTSIITGSVKAVVIGTGIHTELGKITEYLNAQETRLTPMQAELERVGKFLLIVCLALVSLILLVLTLRGQPFIESLLTTISLAIAIVPEGLSAVMTVTLALAVKEMVAKKVVVKKLLAAEGLGSITHIATDKTGTITEGRMSVVKVFLTDKLYEAHDNELIEDPEFERLVNIIKFCNNNKGPTEQALVSFLDHHGYSYELEGRMIEYQFTSDQKRMSVAREHKGHVRLFSKGAPDVLIPMCTKNLAGTEEFTEKEAKEALRIAEDLASQGFRVLALADKTHKGNLTEDSRDSAETDLTFIGLVALMDPLRSTVKETVHQLKQAGVTPLMITGDHPAIARYIAEEAGIIDTKKDIVLTGSDLDTLFGKSALPESKQQLLHARVFARVRPEHKVMIVEMYQNLGFRIAMTGDGVNDAAAIKRADVGIAMSNGMDVTRDISDVVITGTYDALIRAVAIGRTVKLRSQLYLHYLLSGNACEVGIFLVTVLLGYSNPLSPIMLLTINVLTDAMPAMAMAVEPEDPDVTKKKVAKEVEHMISRTVIRGVAIQGIVGTALIAFVFIKALPYGLAYAETIAFTFFIFNEAFRGFTARSFTRSIFSYGIFSNKLMNIAVPLSIAVWAICVYFLSPFLGTVPLSFTAVVEVILLSLIPPVIEEMTKYYNRKNL